MDPILKRIIRGASAAAALQGVAIPLLTSEGVTAKWISGIFGAIGLIGLVAEVVIDTGTSTPIPPPPVTKV